MKSKLLFLTFISFSLFFLQGCPKKPVIIPDDQADIKRPVIDTDKNAEEPSIRFDNWTEIPELGVIYFDFDSSDLRADARDVLKRNAEYLAGNPGLSILIEGHCDERGTIEYNLGLGQKRASAVRQYYGNLGVSLGRIGTISYGEEKPSSLENGEFAWSKNRRAETRVRSIQQ